MEILIEQLKKNYQQQCALNIPHLVIPSGSFYGLVGNNGAGKTTLLRLTLDLTPATAGKVMLNGMNVSETEDWKNYTAAYLSEKYLINYLTPQEFWELTGSCYNLNRGIINERLDACGEFASELRHCSKYIRDLSAGNQQKTGIIAALIAQPKLLVLDEPFNYLDPSSQTHLKHLLQTFHTQQHSTILLSSHNLNHVAKLCNTIALVEKGELIRTIDGNNPEALQLIEQYFDTK